MNSITRAMIVCYHLCIMIRQTTKKEIKRVRSLRKVRRSSAPKGFYYVTADGRAYVADTPGEMGRHILKVKSDLTKQIELL